MSICLDNQRFGREGFDRVAWAPDGTPILLSVLTRSEDPEASYDNELLAEVGDLCLARLT